jgi:hypothetical protein
MLAGTEPAFQASPSAQPFKGDSRLRFLVSVAAIASMMEFEWGLQQIPLFFPYLFRQRGCIITSLLYIVHFCCFVHCFDCFDQVLRVVLGFPFYPRRGRSEIGSIGRIIFHGILKDKLGGVNKFHLRAPPFFFYGLFGVHERSCRFTGGLEHLRYTEYGGRILQPDD